MGCSSHASWLFCAKKAPVRLGVPKSFSFAQSRRSGKPPSATRQEPPCGRLLACTAPAGASDEGGGTAQAMTEGEKQKAKYSLPQSCYSHDSPLVRGGLGCVQNRWRIASAPRVRMLWVEEPRASSRRIYSVRQPWGTAHAPASLPGAISPPMAAKR